MDEAIIEISGRKIRLGAESMEEDISVMCNALLQDLLLPILESAASDAVPMSSERFWEQVFDRISNVVEDLSVGNRKLILRAMLSVEVYRRFQHIVTEAMDRKE